MLPVPAVKDVDAVVGSVDPLPATHKWLITLEPLTCLPNEVCTEAIGTARNVAAAEQITEAQYRVPGCSV